MKQRYKTVLLVLLILIAAVVATNAKDQINIKDRKVTIEPTIPTEANQKGQTEVIEQPTYTDLWTYTSTDAFYTADYTLNNIPGMTQTINLRYPSTLTVFFTSEANGEVNIRVLLDGSELGPGLVLFNRDYGNNYNWESNAFNFRRNWVSAGQHTIKIQQSGNGGYTWYKSMMILANGYGH